jgi:hypothetical protein
MALHLAHFLGSILPHPDHICNLQAMGEEHRVLIMLDVGAEQFTPTVAPADGVFFLQSNLV